MEYNVTREHLAIKEYGRNVQNLINYTKTIPDKEKRQKFAEAIILMMEQLSPQAKTVDDYAHKLWDHFFIIANFDIDVESPYGRPSPESVKKEHVQLQYPSNHIRMRNYGKNLQTMVEKAITMEGDKRKGYTEVIANYMKLAYHNWTNEEVNDDLVKQDLISLSKGQLEIGSDMNIESFVKSSKAIPKKPNKPSNNFHRKNNKNKKRFRS